MLLYVCSNREEKNIILTQIKPRTVVFSDKMPRYLVKILIQSGCFFTASEHTAVTKENKASDTYIHLHIFYVKNHFPQGMDAQGNYNVRYMEGFL